MDVREEGGESGTVEGQERRKCRWWCGKRREKYNEEPYQKKLWRKRREREKEGLDEVMQRVAQLYHESNIF